MYPCIHSDNIEKNQYLRAINPFSTDFGKFLTETVRCYEKNIREFTLVIDYLIYKENTVNHVYYRLNTDELAKIAYDSESKRFKIHKICCCNPVNYIKKDVEYLTDACNDCQKLEKNITMFLENMYGRYDWIVVAFISKSSKFEAKLIKLLNKQVMSGFTELTKGDVSVAVARQAKGTHAETNKIGKSIDNCFAKTSAELHCTTQQLRKWMELVDGIKLILIKPFMPQLLKVMIALMQRM